jgi:hypothetical protein
MKSAFFDASALISQALLAAGGIGKLHAVRTLHVVIQRQIFASTAKAEANTYRVEIYRAQGGKIRLEEHFTPLQRQVTILQGLAGIRRWEEYGPQHQHSLSSVPLLPAEITAIKRRVRLYPRNFLAHADEFQYQLLAPQMLENAVNNLVNNQPSPKEHTQVIDPAQDQLTYPQLFGLELPLEQVCYLFNSATGQCCQLIDTLTNETINYRDYCTIDGIATPYIEETFYQGQLQQQDLIESVSYNNDLAPTLFAIR